MTLSHEDTLFKYLGFPPPQAVLDRASRDSEYFRNLVICRNNREWLRQLFALAGEELPGYGTAGLATEFGTSTLRWAISGFASPDDETFEKRWNACLSCSHLTTAPQSVLHYIGRLIISTNSDDRICGLCGCFAKAKASRTTERCPANHEVYSSLSRWNEPLS